MIAGGRRFGEKDPGTRMSGGKAASLAVGKFREPGDFFRGKFPVRQPLILRWAIRLVTRLKLSNGSFTGSFKTSLQSLRLTG